MDHSRRPGQLSLVWHALLAAVASVGGCEVSGHDGFAFATDGLPADGESSDETGTDAPSRFEFAEDHGAGSETTSGAGETGASDQSTTTGVLVEPCTAIDVLFVMDDSLGMAEEQLRTSAAARSFIDGLAEQVDTATMNLNIAVVTTDDPAFVVPVDEASGAPPVYSSTLNFMTLATLVPGELEAALLVGEQGHPNERPMDSAIGALHPPLTGSAGFNAGFLRDDALLVLVFVTDEEDDFEPVTQWGSMGDPGDWIEAIAAVKGGLTRDVVVLSIVGTQDTPGCDAEVATRIMTFTAGFPHAAVSDACAADYGAFFGGQVATVAEACAGFTPP
jgi:hypothetical protein